MLNIKDNKILIILLSLCFVMLIFTIPVNAQETEFVKSTNYTETGYINYNHIKGYKYVYAFSNGNAATKKYAVVYSKEKITGQTYQGVIENNDCYIALFKTYEELNKAVFDARIPKFNELDIRYNDKETFTLYQNIFTMNTIDVGYQGSVHGDNTIISKTFENYFKELNIKQHRLDIAQTIYYKDIFKEVIAVLPILMLLLTSFIAIRKGISFIISIIGGV